MRLLAGLAFALGSAACAATTALAAPPAAPADTLMRAAYAPPSTVYQPADRLLQNDNFDAAGAPVRWRTDEVSLGRTGKTVDSLRLSVGETLRAPGGLPLNLARAQADAEAYEITLVRNWPRAVAFGAGQFDVDVTPHAGLGWTSLGGAAEAGATLTVGQKRERRVVERLNAMGVRDGADLADQGRWYLFAAASGRAVGLNVLHSAEGWDRAGWTTDPSSALIGDAQVGIGWRKGGLQSSLGYIHREVKGENMVFGQQTRDDSLVAFSLTLRPH